MAQLKFILWMSLLRGAFLLGLLMALSPEAAAQIDELVVTPTRDATARADSLSSIATLDIDADLPIFPSDFLNQAAGVQIHLNNGQEHLTAIRSPVLTGGAGAGSFLYLEDGIPTRAAAFGNVNALIDVLGSLAARVEITRGPASALYGSNAVHGLVNYISAPLDKPRDHLSASYNSYAQHRISFETTRDQSETSKLRFGFSSTGEGDGYRAQSGFQQQKARVQAAWERGNTTLHLNVSAMNLAQQTAGYLRGADAYRRADARQNPNPEAYRDAWSLRSSLKITHATQNGELTVTPYLRSNAMEFLMHFLPTQPLENNKHSSLGALTKYEQQFGRLNAIFGVDVEYTQGELHEYQENPVDSRNRYAQGLHYDYQVDVSIVAPYVHLDYEINDSTRLVSGIRYEYADYDYDNRAGGNAQLLLLYRPDDRRDVFDDISPKFGIVHVFTNDDRLFFNLARAARAPQTSDLYRLRQVGDAPPQSQAIDSETLDSVEIGYRGFTETASYEVAVYGMYKRNHHFRDADDLYVSDGRSSHYGIELEFDWQMRLQWRLYGNASYAVHRYEFDREIMRAVQAGETIRKGNEVDSAPRTLANLFLEYPLTAHTKGVLHWAHVGSYFTDAANSRKYGGHDIFNWSAIWQINARAKFHFSVKNIFNDAYASRADRWFGRDRYFPGLPRTYGASIYLKF